MRKRMLFSFLLAIKVTFVIKDRYLRKRSTNFVMKNA